jgi:hypothetical protein
MGEGADFGTRFAIARLDARLSFENAEKEREGLGRVGGPGRAGVVDLRTST